MSHDPVCAAKQPQKVIILNNQNEKLVGLLHETGSKEIVILCHGFISSKEKELLVGNSVALVNEGISAFRFDFSGNGESDGTFFYGNLKKEVEDLRVVVEYFKDTNRSVSAIVGHSKGGDVVLLYASKYHDVCVVVNVSGGYDLKRGPSEKFGETFMERLENDGYFDIKCTTTGNVMFHVTLESFMECSNTDMHEACCNIDKQCRVLTVHGSADEIISVADAYEFAKIIPNHKLHILEGANHSYTEHEDELVLIVVDFIKACLQQDSQTPP